jgi:hypothetical protein
MDHQARCLRRSGMKRLLVLILVLSLLVVTGTLVSADGQTRRKNSNFSNTNLDKLFQIYGGK